MKINWFTPLPPDRTDIANYSVRVLHALARHAEVVVWTPTASAATDWTTKGIRVRHCTELRDAWTDLNFADFTFFNIGNNAEFHGSILDVMERHGGVVILHDTNVHELIRTRLVDQRQNPDAWLALLGAAGGRDAVALGRAHLRGEVPVDEVARSLPFTETVLERAHGVVLHNPRQADFVRQQTRALVLCSPLPYTAPQDPPPQRSFDTSRPLRLVMFGFLHGTNRRLHPVLQALAAFPERARLHLTLFGELKDTAAFNGTVDQLGIRDLVTRHEFLDEASVKEVLDQADLAINLRYPTRGEASGSQLRIWSHALPSLVSRAGFYRTLPEDAVDFVDPENERADLHRHWAACLADPARYYAKGRQGLRHLQEDHDPEAYAKQLLDILPEVAAYRGTALAENTAARFARDFIDPLNHPAAQRYWVDRFGSELQTWFQLPQ